ncbi:TPA: hypothetical protein I7203_22435 [Vibrio vulnificus]|uniref:hypothetical protein n=1 Tax=Vibrio vulnificus TaxID=672 RepID=UPI001A1A64B9|nr:hypothetical protein [Vibrio vulnificus]HAS6096157.1 hypothetical protein [Vibrio vulnificus]HAS6097789.1 hypothetical protein [Vibrio vulnificus]HAS6244910.1 hypothetical protein [Vibrio vulnificus]HAS6249071.1 hypothetical protein [Vibrio vulnificus]
MSNLFYPALSRKDINHYFKSEGEFFSTYGCKTNYDNVAQDCLNRCVYCDIHIDETKSEKFSLDHFRPQNIFKDKFQILCIHPFNLHLSCQKCNALKSDDWKGCLETQDGPSFFANKGYIDRFQVHASDHFEVNSEGKVLSINKSGPAEYMIGRLLLNRTSRVYTRKLRIVLHKAQRVKHMLVEKKKETVTAWKTGTLEPDEAMRKIEELTKLFERYSKLETVKVLSP